MDRLATFTDLVAVDLPGFGSSPMPGPKPESLSLDRLADDAVAVADALAWNGPVFLCGHSHGGGVAQTAAVRHPRRIAGIVLRMLALPGASAAVRAAGRLFASRSLRALNRHILKGFMTDIFSPEPVPASKVERELEVLCHRPEILQSMVHVALGRPCDQLLESAADIGCPALFLHGRDDALVPVACARAIHERIVAAGGESELRVIPDAGHMLLDYQAARVADAIRELVVVRS